MGQQSTTNPNLLQRNPIWIALLPLLLTTCIAYAQTSISALSIPLILPSAVVFDPQGNLYIAETGNHVIRKVDTLGHITTIAGTGTQGFSGDSGPATSAQLDSPQGLAFSNTTLYIADTHNHRIRAVDLTTNIITTIAGTTSGFSGDNAAAAAARLNLPTAITLDTNQNLYIADTANHRIRRIDATTGIITTIAGNGTQGFSGDSGQAISASIDSPTGLAVDSLNNLYLADTHNHRIRKITATPGLITTIAGTGTPGQSGDTALATNAQLALPHGLTIDPQGNLYLADTANNRIRRIDATTGIITTIAGTGTQGYSGDTGPATAANLDSPRSATTSPTTQLTLADTNNQRVRQLTSSQTINTIAGLGNTTPGTLTLTAPSVTAYGTGQLTATLNTAIAATGSITFFDTHASITTTLATTPLTSNSATLITITLPTGIHTITATYPGDLTHTSAQSTAFTLTITPAPTLTSLTLPTSPATLPANITAQVASTTTGIPTGTLSLLDANTSIATTPLTTTGTATFLIPTLTPGNHTLTAAYAGAPNFQPSTTTPATLIITTPITTPADFTLTATAPTSQTIASGTAATFTFTASTQGSLSSPIILSASGLPLGATATFNPTIIPPGATSPNFTLTITTLKLAAIPTTNKLATTLATLLLPLLFIKSRRRNKRSKPLRALYSITLISLITLTTAACGDRVNAANSEATPPQTYNITITATATTPTGSPLTHSATITLTLQ